MKKPTPRPEVFNGHDTPAPCKLSEKYIHLWHFIADDRWDDGTVRVPGAITLLLDQGWIKAAVSDKDGHQSAFVSADSLEALLRAVNEGLGNDTLEFRLWKEEAPQKKK